PRWLAAGGAGGQQAGVHRVRRGQLDGHAPSFGHRGHGRLTVAMRLRLGLLATRDFRLLWTGETTRFLGTSISELALPLVALSVLHSGAFAVSAMIAAAWVPWVVIGLPAGAWVDRLPRRNIMIAADLVSLAAFVSVPVAAWSGVLTVAQLVTVALAGGV